MIRNLDSFSRLKQQVSGSLSVGGMERLADLVRSPEGDIHYVASGRIVTGADGSVLRKLLLKVQGTLLLPGEEPDTVWSHELDIERIFVLVRSEAELPPLEAEPDDEDYLVADKELNLSELVEDEVLLDLPVSPSLDDGLDEAGPINLIGEPGDAERKNPFAALAVLKKQNH
ncbi:MAG: DUF177 domain-containing protein [Betaproteobacteria bacterium]|nr:DUF177 domain-containing protein [Betaproteobacteria bacterium]